MSRRKLSHRKLIHREKELNKNSNLLPQFPHFLDGVNVQFDDVNSFCFYLFTYLEPSPKGILHSAQDVLLTRKFHLVASKGFPQLVSTRCFSAPDLMFCYLYSASLCLPLIIYSFTFLHIFNKSLIQNEYSHHRWYSETVKCVLVLFSWNTSLLILILILTKIDPLILHAGSLHESALGLHQNWKDWRVGRVLNSYPWKPQWEYLDVADAQRAENYSSDQLLLPGQGPHLNKLPLGDKIRIIIFTKFPQISISV